MSLHMNVDIISGLSNSLYLFHEYMTIAYIVGVGISLYLLMRWFKNRKYINKKEELCKDGKDAVKRRNLAMDNFIKNHSNEITLDRRLYITRLSACELSEKIKSQEIKSREAVVAYAVKAGTLGKELNLIADVNFDIALDMAIEADKLIESTKDKSKLPSLIGLPISIKDQIQVVGLRSTLGLLKNAKNVSTEDSYVVSVLKKEGAIPLCKSNVPQGLLALESDNALYGNAKNPWNITKTAGGSSGGEAGLVSSFCSPIGLGSDIGGSIRNPANYCGIYGFKPTNKRISKKRLLQMNNTHYIGFDIIEGSLGPLSRSVDDAVFFCKSLFGKFPDDYSASQLKFNNEIYSSTITKKLKIAYNYSISRCEVANGIKTEIKKTLDKLERMGHEVIEFDLEKHMVLIDKGAELMANSQKFNCLIENLDGEDLLYSYHTIKSIINMPPFLIKFLAKVLRLTNNIRKAELAEKIKRYSSLKEYFENICIFYKMKDVFYEDFKSKNFDCIVLPVQPFPALDIGLGDVSPIMVFYTMFMNYLDMPAGSIPLGLLKDVSYDSKYTDKIKNQIEKSIKSSANMPIGFQVACLPNKDEECLAIMKMIDDVVKFNDDEEVKKVLSRKISDFDEK